MDLAIRESEVEYIYLLDSDCVVKSGGFLEEMVDELDKVAGNYAIGPTAIFGQAGA